MEDNMMQKYGINTQSKLCSDCNELEIEVGTTGFCGGDAGHGGKTYLRLKNKASTDMQIKVDDGDLKEANSFEILLSGDTELKTFIEALDFALTELKKKTKE